MSTTTDLRNEFTLFKNKKGEIALIHSSQIVGYFYDDENDRYYETLNGEIFGFVSSNFQDAAFLEEYSNEEIFDEIEEIGLPDYGNCKENEKISVYAKSDKG